MNNCRETRHVQLTKRWCACDSVGQFVVYFVEIYTTDAIDTAKLVGSYIHKVDCDIISSTICNMNELQITGVPSNNLFQP